MLLVGSPDLAVGVRVGPRGVLGEASGAALAGAPAPRPGLLSFALVDRGTATIGDVVTTLGSVGERPYVPGIPVGTVDTVHRGGRSGSAPTGTVTPAVDTTTLDVVAVVLTAGRATHPARSRRAPDDAPGSRLLLRGLLGPGGGAARRSRLGARHVPARCPTSCSCWSSRWALLRGPVAGRRGRAWPPGGCSTWCHPGRPTSGCRR